MFLIVWTACRTGGCIRVVFDRTESSFIKKKNFKKKEVFHLWNKRIFYHGKLVKKRSGKYTWFRSTLKK